MICRRMDQCFPDDVFFLDYVLDYVCKIVYIVQDTTK